MKQNASQHHTQEAAWRSRHATSKDLRPCVAQKETHGRLWFSRARHSTEVSDSVERPRIKPTALFATAAIVVLIVGLTILPAQLSLFALSRNATIRCAFLFGSMPMLLLSWIFRSTTGPVLAARQTDTSMPNAWTANTVNLPQNGRRKVDEMNLGETSVHLTQNRFEAYVLGLPLGEQEKREIETHVQVCHICRAEVDLVTQTDYCHEMDEVARAGIQKRATAVQQPGAIWTEEAKFWLNETAYQIKAATFDDDAFGEIMGLKLDDLLAKVEEDGKSPGTFLASVESGDFEIFFALSHLDKVPQKLAVGASGFTSGSYNFPASDVFVSQRSIGPPAESRQTLKPCLVLQKERPAVKLKFLADDNGCVFLRVKPA